MRYGVYTKVPTRYKNDNMHEKKKKNMQKCNTNTYRNLWFIVSEQIFDLEA